MADAKGTAPSTPQPSIGAEALQQLVDQAAHFNIYSAPDTQTDASILATGSSSCIGLRISERLRRFQVEVQRATSKEPLQAKNVVGETSGKFTHRWMMAPDDFVAGPGVEPPPTPLDPSRSQRFVMLDSTCTFIDGRNGFRGFGTGQTFPVSINGRRQLLATAIGTILEGFGTFKGHEAGTYVYCGTLAPDRGFTGNILLRIMDSQRTLHGATGLEHLESIPDPEPDITYIVFRGEAVPSDSVTPRVGPGGQLQGLRVEQGLRLLYLDFKAGKWHGLQSVTAVGELVGRIVAHVNFNPTAPGGTSLDPIPFSTFDEFTFFDREGRNIGGFTGDSSEGRVFNILVGGQGGIRFGGTGRLLSGTGPFQGIEGLLTDNSVVIFTPHVSASVYVLRINDPGHRFRQKLY